MTLNGLKVFFFALFFGAGVLYGYSITPVMTAFIPYFGTWISAQILNWAVAGTLSTIAIYALVLAGVLAPLWRPVARIISDVHNEHSRAKLYLEEELPRIRPPG
jgi:hypothetical protein